MQSKIGFLTFASLCLYASGAPSHDGSSCTSGTIQTEYDVAIIGGGSSGTFTGVNLQKEGKSVVIIERNNRLGGHFNTYVDPVTNGTMDFGAINFVNISTVQDFLAYLDLPFENFEGFTYDPAKDIATPLWADFAAATVVKNGEKLDSQNETLDVTNYTIFESQPGYNDWTGGTGYTYLPDPIPDDLLLPFGEFLKKHDFPDIAYQEWYQGAGNALQQLTLYMLKYIDRDYHNGRVIIGHHENQLLFNTAYAKLMASGSTSHVYLNSTPTSITRSGGDSVTVEFQTVDTDATCSSTVKAKQLVLAIPPLYANLKPFLDMNTEESSLFSKFINITYWAAIVTDTGMPADTGISNVVVDAEANIPGLPGNLGLTPSSIQGRDLHATWWVGQEPYTEEEVSELLIESSTNATTAFGFKPPKGKKMSIAALENHTPYLITVSKEDIQDGFYKNLTALQGQLGTWYTGSAWESEDSAAIWNYTLYQVLPGILKALE